MNVGGENHKNSVITEKIHKSKILVSTNFV